MVRTGLSNQLIVKQLIFFALDQFLQRRLIIEVPRAPHRNIAQNQPVDNSLRRLEAAVHIACGNDGFHCVRDDRVALSAAAMVLAVTKQQKIAQMDCLCCLCQIRLTDQICADSGQLSFRFLGKAPVEIIGNDKAKNRVTQKLQPLVVRQSALAVFVGIRAVRQCVFQQLSVLKNISQTLFKISVHAPTPSEPSSVPHSRGYRR